MKINITDEDTKKINILFALVLIKRLYVDNKISLREYKRIIDNATHKVKINFN